MGNKWYIWHGIILVGTIILKRLAGIHNRKQLQAQNNREALNVTNRISG